MCHFAEPIDDYENGVEVVRLGELGDEVNGDVLPWVFGGLKWHDSAIWFVVAWFGDLACWACSNEIENVGANVGANEMT